MQHDLNGIARQPRQPENRHRLGVALDASEFAQREREVVFGLPAQLSYQLDDGSCAPDCPDCQHRDLRRRYRALVRKRVIARGHKDGRRIAGDMHALEDKLAHALARFNDNDPCSRMDCYGDIAPAPRTEREHIDVAAEIEAIKIDIDELSARKLAKRIVKRTLAQGGLACW